MRESLLLIAALLAAIPIIFYYFFNEWGNDINSDGNADKNYKMLYSVSDRFLFLTIAVSKRIKTKKLIPFSWNTVAKAVATHKVLLSLRGNSAQITRFIKKIQKSQARLSLDRL